MKKYMAFGLLVLLAFEVQAFNFHGLINEDCSSLRFYNHRLDCYQTRAQAASTAVTGYYLYNAVKTFAQRDRIVNGGEMDAALGKAAEAVFKGAKDVPMEKLTFRFDQPGRQALFLEGLAKLPAPSIEKANKLLTNLANENRKLLGNTGAAPAKDNGSLSIVLPKNYLTSDKAKQLLGQFEDALVSRTSTKPSSGVTVESLDAMLKPLEQKLARSAKAVKGNFLLFLATGAIAIEESYYGFWAQKMAEKHSPGQFQANRGEAVLFRGEQ